MKSGWQKLEKTKQKEALRRFSANASRATLPGRGGGQQLQTAALRRLAQMHGILVINQETEESDENGWDVGFILVEPVPGVTATIHPKGTALSVAGADIAIAPFSYTADEPNPWTAYALFPADPNARGERLIKVPSESIQVGW